MIRNLATGNGATVVAGKQQLARVDHGLPIREECSYPRESPVPFGKLCLLLVLVKSW